MAKSITSKMVRDFKRATLAAAIVAASMPHVTGQRDDIPNQVITRAAALTPATLDAENRSVQCVISTEANVGVYDWRSGKVIIEVLLADGCEADDQTPLLRDHMQYNVEAILGSVTAVSASRDELSGLITFGDNLDEKSEGIWKRVKQGHLRRVSVGYEYTAADYETIPAGEQRTINGRVFTAPKTYDLRVVFRWRLREVSVVVIPADKRAKMRAEADQASQRGTPSTDRPDSTPAIEPATNATNTRIGTPPVDQLLVFLRGRGLSADTTFASTADAFAWARQHLASEHNQGLHDCVRSNAISGFVASDFPIDEPPLTGQRSGGNPTPPTMPASVSSDQAIANERGRQTAIRTLATQHPTIDEATVTRCLDEGLTIDQARQSFLDAMHVSRSAPAPLVPTGAPAGHVRGGLTLAILQAGLMARCGIEPDTACLASPQAESVYGRADMQSTWLRGAGATGQRRDTVEQAFDHSRNHRLSGVSFMRFCELMLELDGQRAPLNDDEIMERAFSNGNFTALFGSVVHMMMVQGFTETPATYQEFCRIKDVADFRPNKEGMVNGVGRLKKQGMNGGQAHLLNIEDPTISQVAAERYAGVLKVSDQVIINDSFDVVDVLPREVGISARQIPGDLAFSVLLGNPLLSDGAAFFVNGTNRIAAGALTEDGLNAASTLLKNQKIGSKRIVISESTLLHGTTLAAKAKKVITSEVSTDGTSNVMKNSYRRVEDSAIDLGVENPADNDKPVAGKPASYYVFGDPKRAIVMAFRRGTNRGPISRTGRLPIGEFGSAWDVLIDVGVAPSSRYGVVEVITT